MMFNAFYPPLEFAGFYFLRYLKRAWDQRSLILTDPSETSKTNCKHLQAFVQLYQGPIFSIHWKYAYILNVVLICMAFGPAIPILFPIGFMSLCVLYCTERLMMCYSYQRPPNFDSKVNFSALSML